MAWLRLWASRDFTASAPNVKYVGDITYLPLATGTNLYLATVIDCCSRRVAGWAIGEHMRTELVADALKAAAALRGTLAGAIFHSDHGSQYTSGDFAKLCKELGVTQSMGSLGSSADNALAESFNATLTVDLSFPQQRGTNVRADRCPPDPVFPERKTPPALL